MASEVEDETVLGLLVWRWAADLDPGRAAEISARYRALSGQPRNDLCAMRQLLRELSARALLDPAEAWPLAESALRFWASPGGGDARDALAELQLASYLDLWRAHAENSQALDRRLMELRRIRAQLKADREVLEERQRELLGKFTDSKQQILTIHQNGHRIYADLTKLIDSLSAELRAKRPRKAKWLGSIK
jgi:hypothetical protein